MSDEFMEVNGELIPKHEAVQLLHMYYKAAEQIAGEYHNWNRSPKFRANWPDERMYAKANWRHFMEAARTEYAKLLGNPNVSEYNKRRLFLAIALSDQIENGSNEKFSGLQLSPGSQQFEGDKFENKRITETWGKRSNTYKELLMGSTRYH